MLLAMIAGGVLGALGVPAVFALAAVFFLLILRGAIDVYGGGNPTSTASYRGYVQRQYHTGTEVPGGRHALAFVILQIGGGFLFGALGYGIGWLIEPSLNALVHTISVA
jgi:uncharacterized membrane protein YfcA